MGHLDKLQITNRVILAARPRHKKDTAEYRRGKLIANIEEQIELVKLALQDEPLELARKRGHKVVRVRPRLWWKKTPDGGVYTQVRYNKIPIRMAGRGTVIEVDRLNKLPAAYRIVIRAVRAGEMDRAIQKAARDSRP